jgi:2'-5' RNA ligase
VSLSAALSQVLAEREKTAQIHANAKAFFVHVRVPEHVVSQLSEVQKRVIPDTEKHQEIDHVTLVYTQKALEDHDPEKVHAALDALRRIGERTEPIEAKIQGWGYFDGAQKDGKGTTALVALLDAPGLEHLHVDMSRALKSHGIEPSDSHIFTPHITLGYLAAGERTDKPLEILSGRFTIDKAHVASRDHHEIPLTGRENVGLKAAQFAVGRRK